MNDKHFITLNGITRYKEIPKKYPDLFPEKNPEKNWEWKVKQRKHNGLARAFRKVGKELFVIDDLLAECITNQLDD